MSSYEICVLALFGLMLVCSRTSAYYNKSYGEYRLTIRDNAGSQWMTQAGAQQWCHNYLNGSLLASVTNSDVQTNIEQFANDAISAGLFGENYIIVNAQLESTDWQWINGYLLTNAEVEGQMADSYLLYAYLLTTNYSLMASKPFDKRSYLCQYTGDLSNCTNGFQYKGRCYRNYDSPKVSWFDARNNCQKEAGDLASFDYLTRDDLSTLNISALSTATSTDYWVGLKRLKWKWLDTGSEANYTYWAEDHPWDFSEKCICLGQRSLYSWRWTERSCNKIHQFICLTVLTRPTSQSTVNIRSSPKIMTAIYSSRSSMPYGSQPDTSSTSTESDTATRVGLAVGLGVGIPVVIGLVILAVLLALKTKQRRNFKRDVSNGVRPSMSTTNDQSLKDTERKKTEADVGKPTLRGATITSGGEVTNPYEPLRYDAKNSDRIYEELNI